MTVHHLPDRLEERHNNRPDYTLTIYMTGVRISDGKVEWKISRLDDDQLTSEEVVFILESIAEVIQNAGNR